VPRPGLTGPAPVDAPRGTLFHHGRVDEHGLIRAPCSTPRSTPNTGGQQSKATPRGAAAKFAAAGKAGVNKDLGLLAMTYGNVYVARVAFGARDAQRVRAFVEAASYPGPSLIIAYSPCVAHGYDLVQCLAQQKRAVDTATGRSTGSIHAGSRPERSRSSSTPRRWSMHENLARVLAPRVAAGAPADGHGDGKGA
jgi:hypothetical protein